MLEHVSGEVQILGIALESLTGIELEVQAVRLLGITLSNLNAKQDTRAKVTADGVRFTDDFIVGDTG
jgi:hypothetical protein